MKQFESQTIDINESSVNYPWTAKRTWQLTIDDNEATKKEAFFAVQVNYTGSNAIILCIDPGLDDGRINPVIVPYSGALVPICGVGYKTSGDDAYGTNHETGGTDVLVIAFGGNKSGRK